jgi:two-component system, response regulator YesN
MKVLIADDDMVLRQGLSIYIEENIPFCKVVGNVSNGKEALDFIKEKNIDVVITDIKMPVIDGVQLINEIKNNGTGIKAVVLSGYDDYKYVRETLRHGAVDYLLKPVDVEALKELLKKIKKEKEHEKELNRQYDLLQGRATEGMEIMKEKFLNVLIKEGSIINDSLIKEYGINIEHGYYLIACLGIDRYCKMFSNNHEGNNNIRLMLLKKQIESFDCDKISTISETDNILVVLFIARNKSKIFISDIVKELDELRRLTDENNNYTISIGISNSYTDLNSSSAAYMQAKESYESKFFNNMNKTVTYDSSKFDYNTKINHKELDIHNKYLIDLMETGNAVKVRKCIRDIMDLLEKSNLNPVHFREALYNSALKVVNSLNDFKDLLDEEYIKWEEAVNMIMEYDALDDLEDYVTELFFKSAEKIKDMISERSKRLIEVAKQYIREHYNEDINLKSVAEYVYLNPNYFSELFKNDTSKNFIDFLIETRIDASKKLLAKNEIKIYEVGRMVGYDEPVSFNRAFKKVVGISPSQYKQIIN